MRLEERMSGKRLVKDMLSHLKLQSAKLNFSSVCPFRAYNSEQRKKSYTDFQLAIIWKTNNIFETPCSYMDSQIERFNTLYIRPSGGSCIRSSSTEGSWQP